MADLTNEESLGWLRLNTLNALEKIACSEGWDDFHPLPNQIDVQEFSVTRTVDRKGYRSVSSYDLTGKHYTEKQRTLIKIIVELDDDVSDEVQTLVRHVAEHEAVLAAAAKQKRIDEARKKIADGQAELERLGINDG